LIRKGEVAGHLNHLGLGLGERFRGKIYDRDRVRGKVYDRVRGKVYERIG
jgi:hypothetical protein